ncbi:MAG: class I tRNA ligase family protein [Caldilineaceae bacterium]
MTIETRKTNFTPVPSSVNYPAMEERVMGMWAARNIFERTLSERADGPRYVFFEGPPTANGRPGIHHVLARAFKDMFPRYKIMQGHYVLRKGGWDTHGLPVEIEVEKQLGLSGKQQIEEYGVEEFNRRCRVSAMEYIKEWERLTDRMGFWVDKEEAYVTFRPDYVESRWWILRQFWDKELLYQGYKVVPYCPRCGTPLSSHELSLGYKDDAVDPSVYVKFKIKNRENEYLLAWTTTPWTLPGNVALAVGEKISYVKVKDVSGDILYLAAARAEAALKPGYEVLATLPASELLGLHYEPLYQFYPVEQDYAYVVSSDHVSTEDGAGIVHIAPAFGPEDMAIGRANKLPLIMTIDLDGKFKPEVTWAGLFVKDADPLIEQELASRGLLYRSGTIEHTYPFCWRCGTPLLYVAKQTWYIRTSAHKEELVALNQEINWVPEHIKNGRFGAWLENNIDWALGRDRYRAPRCQSGRVTLRAAPTWSASAAGKSFRKRLGGI